MDTRAPNPFVMLMPLAQDMASCIEVFAKDPSQLSRRNYVRAMAAFVDAWVFATKRACTQREDLFTRAEIALLYEESYDVTEKGEARTVPKYLHATRNFRFAYAMFRKVAGVGTILNVGGAGWEHYLTFVRVRNRLMHPKSTEDVIVTDLEMYAAVAAGEWFRDETSRMYSEAIGPQPG